MFSFVLMAFVCVFVCAAADEAPFAYVAADGEIMAVAENTFITPHGSAIQLTNENNSVSMDILDDYTDVTVIEPPNGQYNCHFYAWANEYYLAGYRLWVHENQISKYLNDYSYLEIVGADEADIVVYYEDGSYKHSARVLSVEGNVVNVISKWDVGPLCTHTLDQCYYWSEDTEFRYFKAHVHSFAFCMEDSQTHERYCTECSTPSNELPHTLVYSYTDTTHTVRCGKNCGYVGTAEAHDYILASYDEDGHVWACRSCDYYVTEAHDKDYTNEGTHHSIACTECSYTSAAVHEIRYEQVNVNYHNKYCRDCSYVLAQAHTWIQSGALYRCDVCMQTSSFIPAEPGSLPPEVLAQLMAVPASEEITVVFIDGVQYAILDGEVYFVVECE